MNSNIFTPENVELIKRAYDILLERDPEFKRQYEEINVHSFENIQNSPILKEKVVLFTLKYDHILAKEIEKMI